MIYLKYQPMVDMYYIKNSHLEESAEEENASQGQIQQPATS